VRRLLPRREHEADGQEPPEFVPLAIWLESLEWERDAVIMRLRQIERVLVQYGRLDGETLPRRVK
jgi:hypothetical protein